MPEEKQEGIIYVSQDFNLVIHLCPCGCKKEVVTPFGKDDWTITIENDLVTLFPSIGNFQFPCKSHYWLVKNEIICA